MKTVRQHYNVTEEDLERLESKALDESDNSGGGDYWQNCQRFIHQKLEMREEFLTDRERAWFESILEVIQMSKY